MRLRYAGSLCPNCGVDHIARHRLLRHLRKGARACVRAAAAESLPLLSDEALAAADRADAPGVRLGVLAVMRSTACLSFLRRQMLRCTADSGTPP